MKKKEKTYRSPVWVDNDISLTLRELKGKVEEWIQEYGEEALLTTDAGPNNVSILIHPAETNP